MPKFRYYITDTFRGEVVGTNDEALAKQYAQAEENFVVDTETGVWIMDEDRIHAIMESGQEVIEEEEEEEEEDIDEDDEEDEDEDE